MGDERAVELLKDIQGVIEENPELFKINENTFCDYWEIIDVMIDNFSAKLF